MHGTCAWYLFTAPEFELKFECFCLSVFLLGSLLFVFIFSWGGGDSGSILFFCFLVFSSACFWLCYSCPVPCALTFNLLSFLHFAIFIFCVSVSQSGDIIWYLYTWDEEPRWTQSVPVMMSLGNVGRNNQLEITDLMRVQLTHQRSTGTWPDWHALLLNRSPPIL